MWKITAAALLTAIGSASTATAATQDVVVTARVRAAANSPIRDAYVGLVPEWRPSAQPLVEAVAEKGVSIFRVPPGHYWLIAGAPGYGFASFGPHEISGSEADLTIELRPLVPATGIVKDESGRPIAGALVSTVNAATLPSLGKLSELALRHLSASWSATTGGDGAWTLPLTKGPVPLLFEAAGRGAEWRIRADGDSPAAEVILSKGATLTVTTDREDANLVVTLSRDESAAASTIPVDRQPLLWARSGKTRVLTWSSLPPGTYTIYAKYPEPRYFMRTAEKLATVVLAPDQKQNVEVTLPKVRQRVTRWTALLVQMTSAEDELGKDVRAFGRAAQGSAVPLDLVIEEVIGGSVLYLNTGASGPPFFATTEDRFFSVDPPLAETQRDAGAAPWTASVHSRADAGVQFRSLEKELALPLAGLARLRDCNEAGDVVVPIEIAPNGFARFVAAAECRSLVLELEPFEPVVASRMLQRGEQSLGEFVLRAAAKADVRVTRDPGGEIVSGAAVRIMTMGDAEKYSAPVVVAEAVADDTGWARFAALPPYRELRAIAQGSDGSKSDAAVLRLAPREHGLVDPLSVREPASLTIDARIDEGVLARFPTAFVATLFLQPAEQIRESERLQQNVEDAPVRFGPLAAGRWQVMAMVKVGTSFAPFALEDVELKAGEARKITVRIKPNLFEGIVTSEGKPVVARVNIEQGSATPYFVTDANGIFRVLLKEPGVYRVSVSRMSRQGNDFPLGNIAFTDPSSRVELAIPKSATVMVRARTGDGSVPPRTIIWMSGRTETGSVDRMAERGRETNAAGEATFEDLAPGVWTFSVHDIETRRRVEKSISVDSGESKTLELELTRAASIEGTIRELGGGSLPRARVECLFIGPSGNPDRAGAMSDGEGHFAIDLVAPPPASALCSVIGPMGSVDAARVTPGQRSDFTVAGATAVLRIPDFSELRNPDSYWLVAPDGRPVSLNAVARMLGQSGAPLSIPALAAGRWKIVRVESLQQWLALASGLGASLPAEAEVSLRAGTTEKIQLNRTPAP